MYIISVIIGKFLVWLMRLKGSRGTALPGLVIEKINPLFLKSARSHIGQIIVITGTNGKTSTQTLLSQIINKYKDQNVLVNKRGANLQRGLIAEFIKSTNIFGNKKFKLAVFEVEEATLPKIIKFLKPEYLIVTNFFRDQLDAYGEIERTKIHIKNAILASTDTKIIANGDDPNVIDLLDNVKNKIQLIKIQDIEKHINYEKVENLKQIKNNNLEITKLKLPELQADLSSKLKFDGNEFYLQLPGYHSCYALAFSLLIIKHLYQDNNWIEVKKIVSEIKPAFGRGEIITYKNYLKSKQFQIFLVKNPIGFDITLDLLSQNKQKQSLIILINDKIADGRDVSWLWDSQIEKLANIDFNKIYIGGIRAYDMRLRIKYALNNKIENIIPQPNITELLKEVMKDNSMQEIKVIATYTAMNQFRDLLLGKKQIFQES